jgi:hypothetical protein
MSGSLGFSAYLLATVIVDLLTTCFKRTKAFGLSYSTSYLLFAVVDETPVPDIKPSLKSKYSMAVAQFRGRVSVSLMKKLIKYAT